MPAGPLHRGALRRLRARADVELCTKRGSGRQAAPALRLVPLLLTGNLCSSSARTPALVRMREARALAFARAFALVAAGAGRTFNPLVPESTHRPPATPPTHLRAAGGPRRDAGPARPPRRPSAEQARERKLLASLSVVTIFLSPFLCKGWARFWPAADSLPAWGAERRARGARCAGGPSLQEPSKSRVSSASAAA